MVDLYSQVVTDILKGKTLKAPWKIIDLIKAIKYIGIQDDFIHCWREANFVVDCLANQGIQNQSYSCYNEMLDMPKFARGYFRMDIQGLPSIRYMS